MRFGLGSSPHLPKLLDMLGDIISMLKNHLWHSGKVLSARSELERVCNRRVTLCYAQLPAWLERSASPLSPKLEGSVLRICLFKTHAMAWIGKA